MSTFEVRGKMSLDGSQFAATMSRAEIQAHHFAREISSRFAHLFTLGAIEEGVRKTVEFAKRMTDLAGRTGVSVEALQRLDRAARDNGSTLEDLIQFWDRLNRSRSAALKDPSKREGMAFGALGISQNQLATQSADDLTRSIALKLRSANNVEELTAPLMAVGGRGVTNLVTLFRAGLDQMYQDVTVMSADTADQLKELADQFENLGHDIMAGLSPVLTAVADFIRKVIYGGRAIFTGLLTGAGEIFRGGGIKKAMEEAGRGMWESVEKDSAKLDEEDARRKERIRDRLNKGRPEFSPFELPKEAKEKNYKIVSDSLTAVGNFLGAARDPLARLAQTQVDLLRRIATATEASADQNDRDPYEGLD